MQAKVPLLSFIQAEPPGGVYDVAIAAVGFETRARYLAELQNPVARQRIALGFTDRQELAFADNLSWFKKAGYRVEILSDNKFGSLLRTILSGAERDPHSRESSLSIWIDVSSFSRIRLALIIRELRDLAVRRVCSVKFHYNIAQYSDPPSDPLPANAYAGPVIPEFAGWSASPELPPIGLVGLGYEEGKALGAVEYLQADEIWAFDPFSPIERYRKALDTANTLLMELCPASRLIPYQIADPLTLFEKLEALVFATKSSGRPHILPFGPKIFALVSLLVAVVHREAAVWRVSAGEAEPASDRLPSDHTISFGIELRAEQ